jgi:Cupin
MAHKRLYDGGWSHEVTVRELPIAKTLAGVLMRLPPGGMRELHWHTAAEWAHSLGCTISYQHNRSSRFFSYYEKLAFFF